MVSLQLKLDEAREQLKQARYKFKKDVRRTLAEARDSSDSKLHDILSNPTAVYRSFRAAARSSAPAVKRMKVGNKLYFLHLGEEGVYHFIFLLNSIIGHISSSTMAELNTIFWQKLWIHTW